MLHRAARVAALYDIHGNLPALDAVLEDVKRELVDLIVIGGDVVPGPMPRETMARVLSLDIPTRFVSGNGDRIVLAQMSGGDVSEVPAMYRDVIQWNAERMDAKSRQAIEQWPANCPVEIDRFGDVLFCHATRQNDRDCFTRLTPAERVMRLFAGAAAPVVVCGHTHMQFDRTVGAMRIINAGSVGAPFAPPVGAHWLLLDGAGVQLRQTAYDVEAAAAELRATGCPLVEETAVRYVLNPPPESEMLAIYARADD